MALKIIGNTTASLIYGTLAAPTALRHSNSEKLRSNAYFTGAVYAGTLLACASFLVGGSELNNYIRHQAVNPYIIIPALTNLASGAFELIRAGVKITSVIKKEGKLTEKDLEKIISS